MYKVVEFENEYVKKVRADFNPQNITNGDMIRALFAHCDIEIDEHKGYVHIFYEDFYTTYPLRWWLEQYKKRGDRNDYTRTIRRY